LIFNGASNSSKGFGGSHLLCEVALAKMDNNFFDSILEDLILPTHIEIIEKLLLSLSNFIFFVDEIVHVLEIFVDVELLPKHR
jgi:hypothetical protein